MSEEFCAAPGYVLDARLPWDLDRPREAEASFRAELEALGDAPESAGRAVELMTQIARAVTVQRRVGDAKDVLAKAERALLKVSEPRPRIRHHLEYGRIHVIERVPARAKVLLVQAYELARSSGETFLAVDAAQMMALVDAPKQQAAWVDQALALAEGTTDAGTRRWLGVLEQSRGWLAFDAQQNERALACFARAVEHLEAEGDQRNLERARYGRARMLRALRRYPEALAMQEALLAENKRTGRRDGLVLEELAECLHALKKRDEAQPYFAQAHQLLSQDPWLVDNRPARLSRLRSLGRGPASEA